MNEDADSFHSSALAALNAGNYVAAAEAARSFLQLDAEHADGWFIMGMIAMSNLRMDKALELLQQAVDLDGENPEYLAQLAKLNLLLNNEPAAAETARRATSFLENNASTHALTYDTLGVVQSKLTNFEASQKLLAQAVELDRGNAQFHFNLASTEQFLGRADAAEVSYRAAIDLQTDFYRAHWALAELKKNAGETGELERLTRLNEASNLTADAALYLGHALYYEYEKQGRYAEAFSALTTGKQARIGQISYSAHADQRLMETLASNLPDPARDERAGSNMIFVVGMPRTGTTLVERILSSHPEVSSFGERQDFALSARSFVDSKKRVVLDEEIAERLGAQDAAAIGQGYLARVSRLRHQLGGCSAYVDKMPLNFLYVGLILRALPGARVVCLHRHPLDTVFSNFRQLFAINFSYYNYQYDLGDTAHYYVSFNKLVAHWRTIFGDRLVNVGYEDLVADPESQVAALLDRLNLPWADACLKFHANTTAVSTASAMQVREPIYTRAVARWQHYAEQLHAAETILQRHNFTL